MNKLTDRQREALDHSKSLCVTAGAGTGKTHVLVTKYIDMLETLDLGVGEILALTFTEKAAQEMKERVRGALAEKKGGKWDKLKEDFLWANISTFHSFCSRVLRDFPIEAGIDPGFAVLDEREAGMIIEDSIKEILHGKSRPADRTDLISVLRGVGPWNLGQYLRALYRWRETSEAFFAALDKDPESVVNEWVEIISVRKKEAVRDFFADTRAVTAVSALKELAGLYVCGEDSGTKYLADALPYLQAIDPDEETGTVCRALSMLFNLKGKRNMGSKKVFGSDLSVLRQSYGLLKDSTESSFVIYNLEFEADSAFTSATLTFLKDLSSVYHQFIRLVDAKKQRQGAIDFSDMIYLTSRLFKEHPEIVQEHYMDRYRYVMVDEFQDTDPVQVRIIESLIGEVTSHNKKAFVVGDPKQSIYLFRDADVTQFKATQEKIQADFGGKEINLDMNFRSTPEVIGFVNHIFASLLGDTKKPWEFGYSPIEAAPRRMDEHGSIELLLCPKGSRAEENRRSEAEMVARKIQNIIVTEDKTVYPKGSGDESVPPRPAGYGDIAVLLERRKTLPYLEWALRRYGIPYHVHAGVGFYGRQEVLDLYNLLCFLTNVHNNPALFGTLRSPYFGLSDAEIFLAAQGSGTTLWAKIKDNHGPEVAEACSLLEGWLVYARREPPVALVNRILRDSGIYGVYGGMPEGEQCIANIEKFLSIARGEQEKGFLSLDSFVAGITLATENDLSEGEARIDTETGDAVNIMTVHASKGLEFPVVILPDMASGMTADASSILIGERYGVGVKIPDPENAYELTDSAMLTILRHENNEKLRAEKKRLFYVACTRAKDHLILCGTEPKEFKQDLSACKNRIDWTCCCLHLTYDLLDSGYAIVTVPGAGEIRVKITTDPDNIRAEIRVPAPELITVPEVKAGTELLGVEEEVPLHETHKCIDTRSPGYSHRHSHPAEKRSFTVSEIELFSKSPEKYEMIYRKKRPERPSASHQGISRPDIRGTVVHRVFEGKDPAVVLLSYGIRDEKTERELQELYEIFLSTDIMQSAVESHCEVPFSGEIEGVRLSGKIDRIVKIADGKWFVIDYKTDEIRESATSGEGMPEAGERGGAGHYEEKKAEKYLLQMAVYATAAERILGVPVTPLLYFTKTGRFVKTPASDTERGFVLKRMKDTVDEMVETEKRE